MANTTQVVIGGFGNVGEQIARGILGDRTGNLKIAAIAARDHEKARAKARAKAGALGLAVPIISADEAPRHPGVLVECSTVESFRAVVEPTLRAGGHVIAISVGALAANPDLIELARETGATLQIAGGTLPGLDILRAAREGQIRAVRLTSHINPASFADEPYIAEHGIDLRPAGREAVPVFSGSAREAAWHFPRHFNVAVTLGLAGIGLDETQVTIRADATLPGARHTITVLADAVELEMVSQNFPSPQNNRTSRVVALSIMAALRRLNGGLMIGS